VTYNKVGGCLRVGLLQQQVSLWTGSNWDVCHCWLGKKSLLRYLGTK